MASKPVYFVSGHLDLTPAEFDQHYKPLIEKAISEQASFVVGDARGADRMAQDFLYERKATAIVFHMFTSPRHNPGFPTKGGYQTDEERDIAMTEASTHDIAYVKPDRPNSGTASNVKRRTQTGNNHEQK